MFPLILIIIPLFLLLRDLKLTNSHIGLVVVYNVSALPFVLWMLYSYVRGIPPDLEEAATVDGATRLQILTGIIAPLLLPGIVVTTMFAFITAWNEFFLALVILESPDLTTLPLRLAQYVGIEGIVQVRPAGRGGPARDHPQHRPLHVLPALAHPRPPLRGGQGLMTTTPPVSRTPASNRTAPRPQKGGSTNEEGHRAWRPGPAVHRARSRGPGRKQATVVKLKFATYVWQPTTVAANKSIVETWNKAHPGIQVEIVPVDVNSVHDKLLTSFVGGTAADIIHDEAADIAGFTQQGYLANLTPLLPKSLKQSIPKDLWATTNFGGKITGVPSLLQTYNIFANMDILKSAGIKAPTLTSPWTWAQFRANAKKLTTSSRYGVCWGLRSPTAVVQTMSLNYGGQFFYLKNGKWTFEFGPKDQNVIKQMHDMIHVDKSVDPAATGLSGSAALPAFFGGKCAMTVAGNFTAQSMILQGPRASTGRCSRC